MDSSDDTLVPNSESRDCYEIFQLSKVIILRTISCNPIEKMEFDFQVNFGIRDK